MKYYLLSDNRDTLLGMRLVGIEGIVVHERKEFLSLLEEKLNRKDIGIILITSKLIEMAPDVIYDIKQKVREPLIVEIPDRHGDFKVSEAIDKYVSDAIGLKL